MNFYGSGKNKKSNLNFKKKLFLECSFESIKSQEINNIKTDICMHT